MRRSLDKAGREDQRTKQRISLLEDAARRSAIAAKEDENEEAGVQRQLPELEEEENAMTRKVERCKGQLEEAEREYGHSAEADESALRSLRHEIEALAGREEGLVSERHRYERDVLPDLNIRLANLEAELRRLSEHADGGPPPPVPPLRSVSLRHPRRANAHNNMPSSPAYPTPPLSATAAVPPNTPAPEIFPPVPQRSRRFSFGHVHFPPPNVASKSGGADHHPYEMRSHPASLSTPAFSPEFPEPSDNFTTPPTPAMPTASSAGGGSAGSSPDHSWASKVMGRRRQAQQQQAAPS
jgi:hypothetical protein